MTKLFKSKRAWISAAIVLVAGIAVFFMYFRQSSAEGEFFTLPLERGGITNAVSATGSVKAVITVEVGSQVSGRIQALYADFNSVVKKGQLIAKIDPANFQAQLERSQADLAEAKSRVSSAEASLNNQRASLKSAEANLQVTKVQRDDAARVLKRNTELMQSGVITARDIEASQAAFDAAEARLNQAKAQVDQAKASLGSAQAGLEQSKAQVLQSEANLKLVQVNLDYTNIFAPIDGVVISRDVDVGQTVAASLSAPRLFQIANDLTKMQVIANIDEADIGKISNRVQVRFTVDAFPGENFTGKIAEIRLNPQTIQNVVTYNVVIDVDNAGLKLKPGMTTNITMTIDSRENVLRIPNSALRFTPPDFTREKIRELMRSLVEQRGGSIQGSPAEVNGPTATQQESAGPAAPSIQKTAASSQNSKKPEAPKAAKSSIPSGLSKEAAALFEQMRNPDLPAEERRSLFGKMRTLSDSDQQIIRESFQRSREGSGSPGETRGGPGGRQNGDRTWGGQRAEGGGRGERVADGRRGGPSGTPAQASSGWQDQVQGGEKIQFPAPSIRPPRPQLVWVLGKDKKPEARLVMLGITDGQYTEIVSSELREGEQVIVGKMVDQNVANQGPRSPFGQPGGGRPGGGLPGGGGPPRGR